MATAIIFAVGFIIGGMFGFMICAALTIGKLAEFYEEMRKLREKLKKNRHTSV